MRAGLLARDFIKIWRLEDIQSDSGQIKKEKIQVLRTRAYVISQQGIEKESGKELFNSATIIFRIRWNSEIKDTDYITYDDNDYKISFIRNNKFDRTKEITAVKINT